MYKLSYYWVIIQIGVNWVQFNVDSPQFNISVSAVKSILPNIYMNYPKYNFTFLRNQFYYI